MDRHVKRTIVAFLFAIISHICVAQVSYSFFKAEDEILFSNDMGLTWNTASNKVYVTPKSLINNPLGERFAIVDNTDKVYWCEEKGVRSVADIIKLSLKKDKYFSTLFSTITSEEVAVPVVKYSRRGGVKMSENGYTYIESVVARELRQGPAITTDIKYKTISATKHTFYFEIENFTDQMFQFILVQYDKKGKKWNVAFNYTNADQEIVLTIPAKSKVELKNQEFRHNRKNQYYLVCLDEGLQLSWQNLLKDLNSRYIMQTNSITEPTLRIYSE